MESQRKKLGNVIKHFREQRGWNQRRMSDVTSTPVATIEAWERGEAVPDGNAWRGLKGAVNRAFGAYTGTYHAALLEQEAADKAAKEKKEQQKMNQRMPLVSSLGPKIESALGSVPQAPVIDLSKVRSSSLPSADQPPKLHAVKSEPAPEPTQRTPAVPHTAEERRASDGRRLMPDRPPGSMRHEAIQVRMDWARQQFRIRPAMPMRGPDGILALMRNRFGVGLDPYTISEIKAEVQAEIGRLPPSAPPGFVPKSEPPIAATEVVTPTPPPTERQAMPKVASEGENISAAVSLILDSVPHLKTFTITVDETGEASCSYTVREVRVIESGGSIKVRR